MKSEFSTHWNSSIQPRKQRKFVANSPLHIRHKLLSTNLSKELRQKHGKRCLPLRKGDEVLVMRGSFYKKKAKVASLNLRTLKVTLEGLQRTKKDGTKVNIPFNSSNLQIVTLNTEDKMRLQQLVTEKTTKIAKEEIDGKKSQKSKQEKK